MPSLFIISMMSPECDVAFVKTNLFSCSVSFLLLFYTVTHRIVQSMPFYLVTPSQFVSLRERMYQTSINKRKTLTCFIQQHLILSMESK